MKNAKTPQKSNSQLNCQLEKTKSINGNLTTQTKPKKNFDYVMNYYNKMKKQESGKFIKNSKNSNNITNYKNKSKICTNTKKNSLLQKNFFYTKDHLIKFAKCTAVKDEMSTVEFSKKNNLTNRTSLDCINKNYRSSCGKIQGIQIKNFKNIIKSPDHNSNKCKSDRTERTYKRKQIF